MNTSVTHASPVPAAVRRNAKAAEDLIAKMKADREKQAEEAKTRNAPFFEADPAPEAQGAADAAGPGEPEKAGQTPAPDPAKAEAGEPTPADPQFRKPDDEYKETYSRSEFLALNGRYVKSQRELAEARDRLRALESDVERLKAARPAPEQQKIEPKVELTPEELEEYGPEFADLLNRVAKQSVSAYEDKIAKLEERLAQVDTTIATNTQRSMIARLDQQMPDWRQINIDPEFIAWVEERDVFSGQVRKDMLNSAYRSNDADRVLAFFKGFQKEKAAIAPQPKEDPLVPDTSGKERVTLESLAAPAKAKPAAVKQTAAQPETVTRAQIAEFYSLHRKGKLTPDQYATGEKRIAKALAEGRVIG